MKPAEREEKGGHMYKKAVTLKLEIELSRRGSTNAEQAVWDELEATVKALLNKALELAQNDTFLVTDWLDSTEMEGYGYIVERDEEIKDLHDQIACFEAQGLDYIPSDLTLNEKIKIEEFFKNLRP